jgi:hypothetical protein
MVTNWNLMETPLPSPAPIVIVESPYGSGEDGDLTIPSGTTFNIHTQTQNPTFQCTNGGDAVTYIVTELTGSSAALATSPASGCLNAGDEVLHINVRGATNNWTNTGHYEFLHVGGVIGVF